jgi:hypothetical protein
MVAFSRIWRLCVRSTISILPKSYPHFSGVATLIAPVMMGDKTAPVKAREVILACIKALKSEHLKTETCSGFYIAINPANLVYVACEYV